jgi:hypothetical protein
MNISIKQKNGEETILQALTKHFKGYTHNSNGGSQHISRRVAHIGMNLSTIIRQYIQFNKMKRENVAYTILSRRRNRPPIRCLINQIPG